VPHCHSFPCFVGCSPLIRSVGLLVRSSRPPGAGTALSRVFSFGTLSLLFFLVFFYVSLLLGVVFHDRCFGLLSHPRLFPKPCPADPSFFAFGHLSSILFFPPFFCDREHRSFIPRCARGPFFFSVVLRWFGGGQPVLAILCLFVWIATVMGRFSLFASPRLLDVYLGLSPGLCPCNI